MKNAITSVNKWLSDNLPGVNLHFAPGEPSEFPAITVLPSGVGDMAKTRSSDVMLAEIAFTADCVSGGADTAAVRGVAAEITKLILGDSDKGVKIPLYSWDYGLPVPAQTEMICEMTVAGVVWEEIRDEKKPEIRIVRIGFKVRAKLDGAVLG